MAERQYLSFRFDAASSATRKTDVWDVLATSDGSKLGTIKWFGRWRQYTFWPEPETTFNPECLRSVAEFCEVATRQRRA